MAAITYKCPNCDGGLVFDPSSQKYHCEFCLSNFTQEELDQEYSQGPDHGREPEYSQNQEHSQADRDGFHDSCDLLLLLPQSRGTVRAAVRGIRP